MKTMFWMVEPLYDERFPFEDSFHAIHKTPKLKNSKKHRSDKWFPVAFDPAIMLDALAVTSSQVGMLVRPPLQHSKLMTQRKNLDLHTCSSLEARPKYRKKR